MPGNKRLDDINPFLQEANKRAPPTIIDLFGHLANVQVHGRVYITITLKFHLCTAPDAGFCVNVQQGCICVFYDLIVTDGNSKN